MPLSKFLNRKPKPSVPHNVGAGDQLAADLQQLVGAAERKTENTDVDFTDELMQQLAIFITARDAKVFDHGYHLGLERGRKN